MAKDEKTKFLPEQLTVINKPDPGFLKLLGMIKALPEEKKAELRAVLIDMATGRRPFLSQS